MRLEKETSFQIPSLVNSFRKTRRKLTHLLHTFSQLHPHKFELLCVSLSSQWVLKRTIKSFNLIALK